MFFCCKILPLPIYLKRYQNQKAVMTAPKTKLMITSTVLKSSARKDSTRKRRLTKRNIPNCVLISNFIFAQSLVLTAPYNRYWTVNSTILKHIMKKKKPTPTHSESPIIIINPAIKLRSPRVPQIRPVISKQLMHFLSYKKSFIICKSIGFTIGCTIITGIATTTYCCCGYPPCMLTFGCCCYMFGFKCCNRFKFKIKIA